MWGDVRIDDPDDAEIEFGWQVDRHGNRRSTKTDGSARTVPIPAELALVLGRQKNAARYRSADSYVFATGTGRPLQQRNVARALREAQRRAVHGDGRPVVAILHEVDREGNPVPVPRGTLPSMHSFRHTVASRAARRRKRGRGRLPPRPPGRDRHSDGVRPRGRRRARAIDAPVADDGGVRRRPSGRAGRAARRLTASGCAGSLPSQLGRQRSTVQVAQPQPRKLLSAVSIAAPIDTASRNGRPIPPVTRYASEGYLTQGSVVRALRHLDPPVGDQGWIRLRVRSGSPPSPAYGWPEAVAARARPSIRGFGFSFR
jgi:hypothetical protein